MFGDSHFRHSLRNHINSLKLGIAVCDASPLNELPEWMTLIEHAAQDCIELLDESPPETAPDLSNDRCTPAD